MKDIKFFISGILIIISFFLGYYYKDFQNKDKQHISQQAAKEDLLGNK